MPNPVVHWEIVGKDGAKLQEYYAKLFGWEVNANNPFNYGLVDTKAGGINGGIGTAEGHNWVTIYVEVQDLDETLQKAESLGGKVVMPPTEIPNMVTIAMFADPEGNLVGLIKSMK
jgi:predicted enzyme related to lactoylglutathione lyase